MVLQWDAELEFPQNGENLHSYLLGDEGSGPEPLRLILHI